MKYEKATVKRIVLEETDDIIFTSGGCDSKAQRLSDACTSANSPNYATCQMPSAMGAPTCSGKTMMAG